VKATERDEVKSLCLLKPLETVRHGVIVNNDEGLPEDPLIAIKPR
jgi:hypothetical protein